LSNHRALIIGGSGGIGRAVTYNLASHGASVVCHGGHSERKIREVVSYVRARGGEARGLLLPLENARDIVPHLQSLVGIDIVVVAYGPIEYAPLAETRPEIWRFLVEMNLTLPGVVVSHYLPRMIQRGWGRIVLFGGPHSGSIRGYREIAPYGAAKLGLSSLVRSAAHAARGSNVTTNCIAPGLVDTEYLTAQRRAWGVKRSPQKRLIPPERIARVMCDIVCAEDPDVNGAVIAVDQGMV
jgi:3-oxoacyl-[acyl-carrier protein] reductase